MTENEQLTVISVDEKVNAIRERMASVETSLSYIIKNQESQAAAVTKSLEDQARAIERLSADIRVNTVATVQSSARTDQQEKDADLARAEREFAAGAQQFGWSKLIGIATLIVSTSTFLVTMALRLLGVA